MMIMMGGIGWKSKGCFGAVSFMAEFALYFSFAMHVG